MRQNDLEHQKASIIEERKAMYKYLLIILAFSELYVRVMDYIHSWGWVEELEKLPDGLGTDFTINKFCQKDFTARGESSFIIHKFSNLLLSFL